ncbi:unnamed protein product [Triticum turgidum subsp. durum]|uniref:Exostosin GT47 domain-containing protein n=1 Tax=Triticum turgidum subsp. durum TaxID=4567 RepID=A0A9R1PKF8_TRITD|nr:unnamed protein product [Triticum turgidum subsp. durum]
MPSRRPSPVILLLLALALALLFLLLSPSGPSASRLSHSFISTSPSSSASSPPSPVKIYLYDLPSKFTYGVVRSYMSARGPSGSSDAAAVLADEELRYPGHQHSAEWWLFKDLRRRGPRDRPVARVDDPAEADLFYVPFFSSLSLVVNPIRPPAAANASEAAATAGPSYSDEAMQDELVEWLERQSYWRRHRGRDHVFICQDPNALYRVVDRISNAVLLVSDFGRLRGDQVSLVKDVILPYSHRINPFKGDVNVDSRPALLFFMGNRYRKEGGKVRDTLFQVLENEGDVIIKHGAQSRVKHYFEYEDLNGPVNQIWRQVSMKAPLIKLLINRNKRLVERGTNETDCSCICSTPSEISTAG